MKFEIGRKEFVTSKIQNFLWDAFCNADCVGVSLDTLLTWPGLKLTTGQIESVEAHYYGDGEWSADDIAVSDIVGDMSDFMDLDRLLDWLVWSVGYQTAVGMVKNWTTEDWAD